MLDHGPQPVNGVADLSTPPSATLVERIIHAVSLFKTEERNRVMCRKNAVQPEAQDLTTCTLERCHDWLWQNGSSLAQAQFLAGADGIAVLATRVASTKCPTKVAGPFKLDMIRTRWRASASVRGTTGRCSREHTTTSRQWIHCYPL